MTMIYIDRKGARVPALGFGTWQLTGSPCVRMVRYALDIGYRHIDTARMYDNEAEVGVAIAGSGVDRTEIFLTTKVWMDGLTDALLRRSVEDSLRKLKTDYVDLLLIHWPNDAVPLRETLGAMMDLRRQGKAKFIGVSNFPVRHLQRAVEEEGADLLANQVEYHPFLSQRPVMQALRQNQMMLTAYSPVAKGEVARDPVLTGIARRHGKTPFQVALRWLVQQDGVAAIPRTSSEANCAANLEIFDFALSEAEVTEIDQLTRHHRRLVNPSWSPAWDPAD
jgi:2,5-diketo-D-gluconate reductase B